jgi:hypothetical protein
MSRSLFRTAWPLWLGLIAACASTSIENVWIAPEAKGRPLGLHKVAAIAMLEEGALRRVAEDELVRAIREGRSEGSTVEAAPSYTVVDAATLEDTERTRAALAAAGFDGAVVLSVVDQRQRVTGTPSVSTGWGYYGRWGMTYDTGSIRTDTIVRVQTSIYSVKDAKLLWSGTSRTYNPRDVADLVDDVARDVGRALRREGLIP